MLYKYTSLLLPCDNAKLDSRELNEDEVMLQLMKWSGVTVHSTCNYELRIEPRIYQIKENQVSNGDGETQDSDYEKDANIRERPTNPFINVLHFP